MTFISFLMMTTIILSLMISLSPPQLLTSLMLLEILSLITIMLVSYNLMMPTTMEAESLLIVFTMSVCEASISLGLLVSLIHAWGSDKTNTLANLHL